MGLVLAPAAIAVLALVRAVTLALALALAQAPAAVFLVDLSQALEVALEAPGVLVGSSPVSGVALVVALEASEASRCPPAYLV